MATCHLLSAPVPQRIWSWPRPNQNRRNRRRLYRLLLPNPGRKLRRGQALGAGCAYGRFFYVMPFVQGETLRDRLNRETQLGVDGAVRIATDVAEALHYAHGQGVIHRDIKPENILFATGRPIVADFGIALAFDPISSVSPPN